MSRRLEGASYFTIALVGLATMLVATGTVGDNPISGTAAITPIVSGVGLVALGLHGLVKNVLSARISVRTAVRVMTPTTTWWRRRSTVITLMLIVYTRAVVEWGFELTTPIYLLVMLVYLQIRPIWKVIAISIAASAISVIAVPRLLGIPLP